MTCPPSHMPSSKASRPQPSPNPLACEEFMSRHFPR
jgi:hypothetical protein